ncbi:hypothetical protein CEXT_48261 [Caerostris extrusa]|uniref:Uncharacterized protein n=1 Tax=Caerostris extrusa TaxID=172846 RepID=A0AAV4N215_CAEEX|nr:hypothetical protein CEXT_48261 [Caerostris extrusa]
MKPRPFYLMADRLIIKGGRAEQRTYGLSTAPVCLSFEAENAICSNGEAVFCGRILIFIGRRAIYWDNTFYLMNEEKSTLGRRRKKACNRFR